MQQRRTCLDKADTMMKELKPQFEHFLKVFRTSEHYSNTTDGIMEKCVYKKEQSPEMWGGTFCFPFKLLIGTPSIVIWFPLQ